MKLSFILTLGTLLTAAGLPQMAGATDVFRPVRGALVQGIHSVHALTLDDGTKGFLGADHKLYLLGASGKYAPAKAGHYMLAEGGCVTVGADAAVDPASFTRLSAAPE